MVNHRSSYSSQQWRNTCSHANSSINVLISNARKVNDILALSPFCFTSASPSSSSMILPHRALFTFKPDLFYCQHVVFLVDTAKTYMLKCPEPRPPSDSKRRRTSALESSAVLMVSRIMLRASLPWTTKEGSEMALTETSARTADKCQPYRWGVEEWKYSR